MKNTTLLLGILSLTACTSTYEDLNKWMSDTRQEAKSHIIPFEAPTVTPPKAYVPPNYTGMNAFDSRRLNNILKGKNAPNLNRPKETLETFSLENLKYVGSLSKGNKVQGFVEAENHVYTVFPGNYIGQNYGRIQSITPDKLILTELIEDSYGNWVYRNAELPLSGSGRDNQFASQASPNDSTAPVSN